MPIMMNRLHRFVTCLAVPLAVLAGVLLLTVCQANRKEGRQVVADQEGRSDGNLSQRGEGQAHLRPSIPSSEEITKLPPDGGAGWNRLIFEKSPYLLQHAANPVDWYPWGEEAFNKARTEDRPVFLSIGYSTCHWCHVMEAESF